MNTEKLVRTFLNLKAMTNLKNSIKPAAALSFTIIYRKFGLTLRFLELIDK